ncbi:MAG TPA: VWA domain-containing protein, partial [bacterium]|nr:VWA domain-containing protein [bacterium]
MSLFSLRGFEHPAALALLLLVPVIAVFYALALRSRRAAMAKLLGDFGDRAGGASRDRRAFEAALATLCVSLCAVALAGPHWGKDHEQVRRQGADVVVVLDLSRSMLAEDSTPSRLGRARREIRGLLDAASADRVALVTFAGDARLTCPLTLDHDTLGMFVDEADPNVAHRGGSNLAQALEVADKALDASSGAGKAVVVLSDGEDFNEGKSSAAVDAAAKLLARGTHVYSIGLGTRDGAKIPMTDDRGRAYFFQDARGKEVVTKLESAELEAVARAGGGEYLEAERVAFPMDELWRKRISRLARGDNGTQDLTAATARFQWFLAPAILVAMLWWLLPLGIPAPAAVARGAGAGRSHRRGERIAASVAVALLLLGLSPSARADGVDEGAKGDRLYRKGEFDGASSAYDYASRTVAAPNGPFNLGNAKFRAKKYREAARAWTEAEKRASDPETRRDASFNRANALLAQADDKDPQRVDDLKAAI